MVCTRKIEYDGRNVIVIGVDIVRPLLRVYVVVPASAVIIIIIIVIIFSRGVVFIGLVIVRIFVGDFESQSTKEFQSNRGFPREPPDQPANKIW